MILYHGSNVGIDRIDLSRSMPYKDFGRGFYLTSIPTERRRWLCASLASAQASPW